LVRQAVTSGSRDSSSVTPWRESDGFIAVASRSTAAYARGMRMAVALTFHR
jgi:hypothetical protein